MTPCKACNRSISSSSKYCQFCGAKIISERLTVKNLLKNGLLSITNLDFPFFHTIKDLVFNPAKVTVGYIKGTRKKYTSPIRFALIILSIYGLYQFFFNDFLDLITNQNFLSSIEEGWTQYDDPLEDKQLSKKAFLFFQKQYQFIIFFTIPVLAFWNFIFGKSKKYNFAEHLVVATYAVSVSILLSIFLAFFFIPFNSANAIDWYMIVSTFLQLAIVFWIFMTSIRMSIFKQAISFILSTFIFLILFTIALFIVLFIVR